MVGLLVLEVIAIIVSTVLQHGSVYIADIIIWLGAVFGMSLH